MMAILTFSISALILSGTILGVEEGANFVRIKTVGWAKDQRGPEAKIYDIFDLSACVPFQFTQSESHA